MVNDCETNFNGPEYAFISPEDGQLVRKTLCEDRDCDVVLREMYEVTRLIRVDTDEEVPPRGTTCQNVLQSADDLLEECPDGSRVITDIDNAELAHNDLHDETFSVLFECPIVDEAFLLYFKRVRTSQVRSSPKTL